MSSNEGAMEGIPMNRVVWVNREDAARRRSVPRVFRCCSCGVVFAIRRIHRRPASWPQGFVDVLPVSTAIKLHVADRAVSRDTLGLVPDEYRVSST